MANIKKGDLVQVIAGRKQDKGGDRGKQGKVLEVLVEQNRVVVEGVNFVTKHTRVGQSSAAPRPVGSRPSRPRSTSPTSPRRPLDKKPTRVGHRVEEQVKDGVKRTVRVRYAKKSGKDL